MNTIKIGLLGLGNIGTGAYKTLSMNETHISHMLGARLEISRILEKDTDRDRGIYIDKRKFTQEPDDIFNDPEIRIVIELLGGVEPATSYMLAAMNAGKSVVTANKAAVAANYLKLMETARRNNVEFRFEASVGGGIPVINALSTVLRANQIEEVLGIVNGTTNYILTQMADNGLDYNEALSAAQHKGFAEADPSSDVEGTDAANKLTILTALAFGKYVAPQEIPTKGITSITKNDIEAASREGCKIKLIAKASIKNGKLECSVEPVKLTLSHPLCGVNNEFNAIYITGNAVGELMFYGKGAGPFPTGSAIMGDVMEIAKMMIYCKMCRGETLDDVRSEYDYDQDCSSDNPNGSSCDFAIEIDRELDCSSDNCCDSKYCTPGGGCGCY